MPVDELRVVVGQEDVTPYVQDLSWSAIDPGGFEIADFTFPRTVTIHRGDPVRIESYLDTAWEGRVGEVEREWGGNPSTSVSCEGNAALLKETDMLEVYVDRDLSQWQPAPRWYRAALLNGGLTPFDGEVRADDVQPALMMAMDDPWTTGSLSTSFYVAHPDQDLGLLAYTWKLISGIGSGDTNWVWTYITYHGETQKVPGPNLRAAGPAAGVVSLSGGVNALQLYLQYAIAVTSTGTPPNTMQWMNLVVYGNHGLPIRGDLETDLSGATGADLTRGVWASDVARHALTKVGGISIGVTTDASGFTIPQLAYREYVKVGQTVDDASKFVGFHYGVWEHLGGLTANDQNPRCDFRQRPEEPTVWITRADCDRLRVTEQLQQLYDQVRVNYQDSTGASRAAYAERSNDELNRLGTHRLLPLDGGLLGPTSAARFADFALRLSAVLGSAAGQMELTGRVQTAGGTKPAYMLRPGIDRIRVTDYPDIGLGDAADFHVKRIEARVGQDGIRTSAELGTGADLLEVLQAQLGVVGEFV